MSFDVASLGSLLSDKGYIRGPFGSALKRQELKTAGIPVYEQQQAIDGHRNFRFFVGDTKFNELKRFTVRTHDLIVSCSGTVGRISIIKEGDPLGIISQALLILRPNVDVLLPRFLYYFLSSPQGQRELLNASQGAVQLNIAPRAVVERIPTPLPVIAEQELIVSILEALDDRITLLRETNATLEAIAQALFKSWFVDFDPVRAKQEGRTPEGMDEATAALFPDSFEESELGLVPKGWKVCSFTDTIKVIGGGTPKTTISEYWNGSIPWFSVVDAPARGGVFVIDTEKHITDAGLNNSSTRLLPAGTTIISARGTVGKLALCGRDMAMNQSCYGLRGKSGDSYYTYFSTHRLVETLKQRSHGSVFDTITNATLAGVLVTYPTESIVSAFENLLSPVMERIKENLKQAQTLATLRDTLLPRLISGQLRLPEAEALLEEATA